MAIKLVANYSKRLGLPGYSSHSFALTVETEITNVDDVAGEAARLYALLQGNVDAQIRATGFVPPPDYGLAADAPAAETARIAPPGPAAEAAWACSDKQRELVLALVAEHGLAKREVEELALERFGKPVRQLNRLEMSGLIDELFERCGGSRHANGNGRGRKPYRAAAAAKGAA